MTKSLGNLKVGDKVKNVAQGGTLEVIKTEQLPKAFAVTYQDHYGMNFQMTYSGRTLKAKATLA